MVIDLGFGDSGKGSVTDFLVRDKGAGLVVRFNGGAQAGHTVVLDDGRHHTFAQFGAGSFVDGVRTHLGPSFVMHPGGMQVEADRLGELGVDDVFDRTTVDQRALVISPFQQAAGRLRELIRGDDAHGTCGVGFGEAVADAEAGLEDQIVAADLRHPSRLQRKLASQRRRKRAELVAAKRLMEPQAWNEVALLDDAGSVERVLESWRPLGERLDVVEGATARRILSEAESVVFEGAQGVLLDERWGFHPHTTWSDCTVTGAMNLLSGLDAEVTRLGVTRCYGTRHGKGPFPAHDKRFDVMLGEDHNHDLGWQGRFRRGPLDLVLLRYALEVCGGVDGLAVTCLDRLEAGGALPMVFGYDLDETDAVERDSHGQVRRLLPGDPDDLEHREALGQLLGWAEPLMGMVPMGELNSVLRRMTKTPVVLESRGPTAAKKRWVNPG